MSFHHHVSKNGLTIIGESSPSARSASIGFFVRTGSRDESAEESGVSHFLEHMLFKGTPRRSALDVNVEFDRIGADYNAFTSEENTVYYASLLPEYLEKGIDILADIMRPSLRQEDFDTEKKVILEEIGMYEDQPQWVAYDNARKAYFREHPLGNTVLGSPESVQALTRTQMLQYFERRYVGSNITFSIAGNFDWDKVVNWVDQRCQAWPLGEASRNKVTETKGNGSIQILPKPKVTQEHVILISPGPSATSPMRFAADILGMVLGDVSGSRLYWALVDPGLAESADVGFHDYEGTGSFFTSYSSDPEEAKSNLQIIRDIFKEVHNKGVTEEELNQAKNKVLSRIVRSGEKPRGRMQALGAQWTYLKKYRSVDEDLQSFDAVTRKDVEAVLDQYSFNDSAILALGPIGEW